MKRNKTATQASNTGKRIKLRVNSRTIIIVKTMEAVKMWLTRYPEAQIIT